MRVMGGGLALCTCVPQGMNLNYGPHGPYNTAVYKYPKRPWAELDVDRVFSDLTNKRIQEDYTELYQSFGRQRCLLGATREKKTV